MLTTVTTFLAAAGTDPLAGLKHLVNAATQPAWFISICCLIFALMFVMYKVWTKPAIFAGIFVLFCLGYFGSISDPNFRSIVAKPDNVPISIIVISVMLCIWVAMLRASSNDPRPAAVLPL